MDRRHQVFVSSTFLDLQAERAAVVSALLQLEAFPAGMELFPAADDDAWTLITRVIDSSDYYLLVVGGRYGAVDPDDEISFTEKEYNYAVAQGKPVMAFLHANPEKIELGKSEKDNETRRKLEAFRKKVEAAKHVKYWTSAEDLAGKVALSFASFRQSYPAPGWVRGDETSSAEALGEINDLRKRLAEATRQLETARTRPPLGSEDLAQGTDEVELDVEVVASVKESGKPLRRTLTRTATAKTSWDELFSAVGPALLDEATQRELRPYLDQMITGRVRDDVREYARRWAEGNRLSLEGAIRISGSLSEDDLTTVLLQLRALGLVTKSERRRSVSDNATYWTLTPYGDAHLTSLRAMRRPAPASLAPEPANEAPDGSGALTDDAVGEEAAADDAPTPPRPAFGAPRGEGQGSASTISDTQEHSQSHD